MSSSYIDHFTSEDLERNVSPGTVLMSSAGQPALVVVRPEGGTQVVTPDGTVHRWGNIRHANPWSYFVAYTP